MKNKILISVAIATYNGEKYIKQQLISILNNLPDSSEIIISDDGSTDKTLSIIRDINDKRIKIINGPKKGLIKNFENAISKCNGKYIFLSDQDDVWTSNKIEEVLKCFKSNDCSCVVHNCNIIDINEKEICESFFSLRKSKKGVIHNIKKNSYIGCCMAIKRDLLKKILPFPNNIPMHDQWIGIMAEKYGDVTFLDKVLLHYRRHNQNASGENHLSLNKMIMNRFIILINYLKRR